MRDTQIKMIIKKFGVGMTFYARKVKNKSMMLYLKVKRYAPEGQEAITNLLEQKKETSDKQQDWCKKFGLSSEVDIDMVHRYSHLVEKLFRTAYNTLGIKVTGTPQACDGCARSKVKAHVVRKKDYTRASHPGENIFAHTAGPFLESLIVSRYWIGVVENYSRYSRSFFTKTKSQLLKNMVYIFEKMTSRGELVKYLCY